jgi:hypothetical protein
LGLLGDFGRLFQFAWDGGSTTGTVTAVERENHNRVRVPYQVNGQDYEVTGSNRSLTETGSASFTVGQSVTVYYLRAKPEIASVQAPPDLLTDAIWQAVFLAALGATYVAWLVRWWSSRSSAAATH